MPISAEDSDLTDSRLRDIERRLTMLEFSRFSTPAARPHLTLEAALASYGRAAGLTVPPST